LLPPELANTAQAKRLYEHGCVTQMDIVQLIYRPIELFEFSRSAMEARWQQGLADAHCTLQASPWLEPTPSEIGVRVFDVMHDILAGYRKPKATERRG
jgi:NTE family protein